ncbi:hypothetical protein Agub_g2638 [Astrephomene gubernaculifera]|uniref:Dihydrolipoamide acetyltransferase component of pyruvate dehydrogenase complex n=1 Tax=Astrephomene gubernaculifera TaxID=47775 RepID=A0AAD3DJI4_9CHLO|nr:hypothetical protein Agub_g2638 [Astrephomene gubernaculifera]
MFLLASNLGRRTPQLLRRRLLGGCHSARQSWVFPVAEAGASLNASRFYAKLVSFPLAQTGEGISECELVAWAVKVGDVVSPFEKLCDVQSDKASIEITSRYAGRVVALHHSAGAMVKVGAALVDLEVADEEQVAAEHLMTPSHPGTTKSTTSSTVTASATTSADAAHDAALAGGLAAASSSGSANNSTVGITTGLDRNASDKQPAQPSSSFSSPTAAVAAATPLRPPAAASSPFFEAPAAAPPPPSFQPGGAAAAAAAQVHASPAVRALAREAGVDISAVVGTGPGGRITKPDLLSYIASKQQHQHQRAAGSDWTGQQPHAAAHGGGRPTGHHLPAGLTVEAALAVYQQLNAAGGGAAVSAASPHVSATPTTTTAAAATAAWTGGAAAAAGGVAGGGGGGGGGITAAQEGSQVVPLRGYRRAMVRSMTAASSVPVFHLHEEVRVDRLMGVRAALRDDPRVREQGLRLTVLPLLLKALSAALLQHPQLNASLAPSGTELLLHQHHHIGVAMATPGGLVVPVLRHVQRKSLGVLAAELAALQQLAAAGRLPAEALTGGTVTVSNIGSVGGTYAAPLVTPPESLILALGRVQVLPRYLPPASGAADGRAAGGGGHHHHHQQQQQQQQQYGSQQGWYGGAQQLQLMPPPPPPLPVPVSIMPVSWGADHRLVDGAALAALSNTWRGLVEQPERLMLELV